MRCFLSMLLFFFVLILTAGEKILVWQATSPNLPGKLYLAGSVHIGKKSWYPLDSAYDKLVNESSAIYYEIHKLDKMEAAQISMQHGFFPGNENLSHIANMSELVTIKNFMSQYSKSVPVYLVERFRPWLLNLEVAGAYLQTRKDLSRECGLESVFTKTFSDKPSFSLETIQLQVQSMSKVQDSIVLRMLLDSIRDFKNAGRDLERIFQAFETGDPAHLVPITTTMAFRYPAFYQSLIADRNQLMGQKIYRLMKKKQTVFILVGAAHLTGKDSLLDYLRERDCLIEQVNRSGVKGKIQP